MKDNPKKSSRRNFLGQLLVGWIGMLFLPVVYVVVKYLVPPAIRETVMATISGGKLSAIPPNSAKIVKFNKKPIIVVHTPEGDVKAFSAVCTHLGCVVDYDQAAKDFHCYCHDSIYDLNGKNIAGPARLPLPPYKVTVQNDDISISTAPQA